MTGPTLRELVGLPAGPVRLADSALVLIDCQNTYTYGVMELEGVQRALDEGETLLDRARTAGIPIIHIQHNAAATATRALPGPDQSTLPPSAVHEASLAAVADMFAAVVSGASDIPD